MGEELKGDEDASDFEAAWGAAPKRRFAFDLSAVPGFESWQQESLASAVESRGFYPLLNELARLAECKGYGTLRYWIKCAADVAKNSEYGERPAAADALKGE